MSIVLVHVTAERALVAVDTVGFYRRERLEPVEAPKMLLMPHIGAALAVSGNVGLLTAVYSFIAARAMGGDFDAVLSAVRGGLVDEALRLLKVQATDVHVWEPEQFAVLAGYSAGLGRMCAIGAHQTEGHIFRVFDLDYVVAPPITPPVIPDRVELMLAIAGRQVGEYGERGPMGGRLLVAELTPHSMTMTPRIIVPNKRGPLTSDSPLPDS